eukprot:6015951-Amphidinium_carterae.4
MQPSWNSDTRQFTKQYYKWLEDINRYEAENGRGTITDHVKIVTVVNNLKGNIAQKLMMRINQATKFDDVHQWISNYFNSTYIGTDEDNRVQVGGVSNYGNENYDNEEYNEEEYDDNWDYDSNDPVTIAFMKGKARGNGRRKRKRKREKGKGKKGKREKGKREKGKKGKRKKGKKEKRKRKQEKERRQWQRKRWKDSDMLHLR